jgi:WD40 repeat protein
MGVVYRARQHGLDRLVALKVLRPDAVGPEPLRRFRTEARALGRLGHPNIVQVYEVGEHQGRPYFSLELVEGGSLDRLLRVQPLLPRQAAAAVETLARAVHGAHRAGLVHRDLKPANVLVGPGGLLKITDFGLVKQLEPGGDQTQHGAVLGTPAYMAPEQADGDPAAVGPAADLYALGAILYECLTGRPPFQGATVRDTLEQVRRREPVPVRQLQPKVPRDLETVCHKCLAKDPRRRYLTAEELADDLRRWQEGKPVRARPLGPLPRLARWCRREPWLALAGGGVLGLLLALVAVLAGGAARQRELTEQARQQAANAESALEERRQAQEAAAAEAKVREDTTARALEQGRSALYARLLALAQVAIAERDLGQAEQFLDDCAAERRGWEWGYLQQTLARRAKVLRGHTQGVMRLAFSPDGKRLASADGTAAVRVWGVEDGREIARLDKPDSFGVFALAFSPDGRRLATAGAWGKVRVWDADTGKEFYPLPGPANAVRSLAFGPDGILLAAGEDGAVHIWSSETRQPVRVLKAGDFRGQILDLAFSPDGNRVAGACEDQRVRIWKVAEEAAPLTFHGFSKPAVRVGFVEAGHTVVACSPTGKVCRWFSANGLPRGAFPSPDVPDANGVALSPDGNRLAFAAGRGVALFEVSGRREEARLRGHLDVVNPVVWSPDGNLVASGGQDNCVRIWPVGGDRPSLLPRLPNSRSFAALAPDGRRVAYQQEQPQEGGRQALVLLDLRTGQSGPDLSDGHLPQRLVFSGGGEALAVACLDRKANNEYLVSCFSAAGGQRLPPVRLGSLEPPRLALTADGSLLAALATGPTEAATPGATERTDLRVMEADGGRVLFTARAAGTPLGVAFSAEGDRLLAVLAHPSEAGRPTEVKAWDARSGQEVGGASLGRSKSMRARFSPDGRWVLTEGSRALRLWDARTGEERATLAGHRGGEPNTFLVFNPAGTRVVAKAGDALSVWEVRTGQHLLRLGLLDVPLSDLAFSADGRRLTAVYQDGRMQAWDSSP